jgi:signal transduction histidine kinase/DNA-binding response OmpR family regulator
MTEPRQLLDRIAIAFGDAAPAADQDNVLAIHDVLGETALYRDVQGVILAANRTFREMTGTDSPVGRTCADLGLVFRPLERGNETEVEFAFAGHRRVFRWQDVTLRSSEHGHVLLSIGRDVTADRLRLEAADAARRTAEEETERKARLLAMVSHEIRTPLSGLLGMGQLLAGTRLNPEQANYLEGIRRSGTDLAHLVEDLLDFSTLSARKFHFRPRSQPIRPLIENIVEMLSSRAHAKGIEIGAVIDPALPGEIDLDPGRFRQVLYNVIGNAVKFTEQGGVLVRALRTETGLEICVEDTGPGMNAAELQRIFGEFEQGDLSRAREGGVGLGLAISARIMAEAGGAIVVESAPGIGTTFRIRLATRLAGPALRHGRELEGMDTLLIAPDGPAARALAASLSDLGAEVRAVADISAARLALAERSVDGVIVDHRLDTDFAQNLARDRALAGARKVFLVNPESRPGTMSGDVYDSWLIRPLREQSLIDVLTGKLRGLEARPEGRTVFPVLAAEAQEEGEVLSSALRGGTILLAEDDPVNAMIVRSMLEKAGFKVRSVTSFVRLAAAHAEEPAMLIVSDNNLDDGSCDRFVAGLRDREEAEGRASTPLIVLTADGRQETRHDLLSRGANLVLVKPAKADALVAAIIDLVGRRAA